MKSQFLKVTLMFVILAIAGLNSLGIQAQVTIGSSISPSKGVILELKNQAANAYNETVNADGGGLVFPRVKLQNRTNLLPFVADDADWKANKDNVKEKYTGMVVYNLLVSPPTISLPDDEVFSEGLYVWNGSRWNGLGDDIHRFFYMPSFNIELGTPSTTIDYYFDLYAEYVKQFTNGATPPDDNMFVSSDPSQPNIPAHKSNQLYLAKELNFIVTYYDKTVITVESISPEGVMKYKVVDDTNLTNLSYINVILEVR
jgi:hypothetical protein